MKTPIKIRLLTCTLLVALSGIAALQAQTIYENYAITTLRPETFILPEGVAVDAAGNIYVSDLYKYVIYKITPAGVESVFIGRIGDAGSADGTRATARLGGPTQMAFDRAGNLYFGDAALLGGATLRKVTPAGIVTTLAGSPAATGSVDGTGSAARFGNVQSVAPDRAGNIYVADSVNETIRVVTPANVVTTIAGMPGVAGSADGMGSAARFSRPNSVAVGRGGYVYVADANNSTIRQVTPAGVVTTVAGLAGVKGSTDGAAADARFQVPLGIAVDPSNNLYITDDSNATVRKISAARQVTTLAGSPGMFGFKDGIGADARFAIVQGIAVDAAGTIYVCDTESFPPSHIRIGVPAE